MKAKFGFEDRNHVPFGLRPFWTWFWLHIWSEGFSLAKSANGPRWLLRSAIDSNACSKS